LLSIAISKLVAVGSRERSEDQDIGRQLGVLGGFEARVKKEGGGSGMAHHQDYSVGSTAWIPLIQSSPFRLELPAANLSTAPTGPKTMRREEEEREEQARRP